MMNLLIMGKPGAGKGTQAQMIVAYYRLVHISTGNIFREEIAKASELGVSVKQYLEAGELVPDYLTNAVVKNNLKEKVYPDGFLLDGYPRTIQQAKALDLVLNDLNKKLTAVINIDVEDEEIVFRLSGRRICVNCQEIYHIDYRPTKVAGVCDVCQHQVIQRVDDTKEAILNRIEVYNKMTKPLLAYYSDQGLLLSVKGLGTPESVFDQLIPILDQKNG